MESIVAIVKRHLHRKKKDGTDGFLQLFISKRLIQGAAAAILGIFVPIFLYETTGEEFYIVGVYYALISLLYVFLLVPAMKVTNKIGFSHVLVMGMGFNVILYTIMFFLTPENVWYMIFPLALALLGFRLFHWVPFHVDFTLFTKNGERGRQVSLSFAVIAFMGVIGPILAGFIITHAGYNALFGTAIVLLVIAMFSYALVPETATRFEWSYKETFRKLFSKDMRGMALGQFANGAETGVNAIVWPIFLFVVLNGDVFEIGAVSTIVVGVTIGIQLVLGKYLDRDDDSKEDTLKIGSTLYALGWVFKMFVLSAIHVFLVGMYHNIVKIFTKTPFVAILYDMSEEQGRYIDEFTVLSEMAVHSGRALSLIGISVMTLFVSIEWTFLIAVLASLALNLIYRVEERWVSTSAPY